MLTPYDAVSSLHGRLGGLNCMFSIVTTWLVGAAALAGTALNVAASIAQTSAAHARVLLPDACRRLTTAFLQRRLHMLRMFEMRDESRLNLRQEQRLQLIVSSADRNQRFIEARSRRHSSSRRLHFSA